MGRKLGALPLWGGPGSPCNTMSPGPTSTSLSSGILIHPAVWPQQTRAENGGGGVPLFKGELGPDVTQWPGPRPTPLPSGTLIHAALWPQHVGQNWGCCVPFWGRAVFPSNTMTPGPRSTSVPSGILIHPAVWLQQTWTENCFVFFLFWSGGAGSPSKTIWPGPRPTSMPSLFSSHQTVWPRYTNVTDRQDRQTERSDSIWQTVLQTVAQKQKYDSDEIMSRSCCRNAPLIPHFYQK